MESPLLGLTAEIYTFSTLWYIVKKNHYFHVYWTVYDTASDSVVAYFELQLTTLDRDGFANN